MDIPQPIKDLQALTIVRHRRIWKPFMKKYDCRKIAELGVFAGQNFGRMIEHQPELAVAVDAWKNEGIPARCDSGFSQETMEKMYQTFKAQMADKPFVRIIRDYTSDVAGQFPDEYFDLIYVDADHTYEGCKDDLVKWYPKVKKGRFLTGDDYSNNRAPRTGIVFGVVRAVNEFASQQELQVYQLPKNGWAVIK